jgi:hypothetical protein
VSCDGQEKACRRAPGANETFCSSQKASCVANCNYEHNRCTSTPYHGGSAIMASCSSSWDVCIGHIPWASPDTLNTSAAPLTSSTTPEPKLVPSNQATGASSQTYDEKLNAPSAHLNVIGQVQTPAAAPTITIPAVSQISDGQIQALAAVPNTVEPSTRIFDSQTQAASAGPNTIKLISQIDDGQIQAPTAAPVITKPVAS